MERKFTDDEIVKALEMCNFNADCDNCPCVGECWDVNKYAIDIINCQKAEIEELTKLLRSRHRAIEHLEGVIVSLPDQVRAEAIKEFAERLQEKAMLQHGGVTVVYGSNIDNLVKEMMGEDNGN